MVDSVKFYENTPKSITIRLNQKNESPNSELDITDISLVNISQEYCPRISANDLLRLLKHNVEEKEQTKDDVFVVDVRSNIL